MDCRLSPWSRNILASASSQETSLPLMQRKLSGGVTCAGTCSKVPPHRPELPLCVTLAFGPIKKALKGHTFGPAEDVKAAVVQWYQKQPRGTFRLCVHGMPASTATGTIFNRLYSLAQPSTEWIACKQSLLC